MNDSSDLLLRYCWFHALQDYPGPLIAKITDLYGLYLALNKNEHLATRKTHLKYGPVIRQGPNKLIFNSAKALRDIYNDERLAKAQSYQALVSGAKALNAVNERSMRRFEPVLRKQINIFLKRIFELSQSIETQMNAINMINRIKQLNFDIVSQLAFGYPLNSQADPKYGLGDILADFYYLKNLNLQFPCFQYLQPFFFANIFNHCLLREYHELVTKMITSRISRDRDTVNDLYSIVAGKIDTKADGSLFFLPAGGDTVSTGLSTLFFYFSTEIQGGQELTGCQYLRDCIDEAVRLSPPVSGTLWRELSRDDEGTEPLIIDGHIIPRGTQIGVNIYALHHNEEYFPEPFAFKPERWLFSEDGPKASRQQVHDAFAALSLGARGFTVAKTLWYFDFECAPGGLGEVGAAPAAVNSWYFDWDIGSGDLKVQ
ncbi:cytochrome P450 [Hypomontagnella monticulosa]|nr:cytochrome P450 [Hypomontagnella monticulosa]